ncbi:hypothetical protein HYQ46_005280 [Verticillium longisporum]|nr:hypothetical protein HYQ46_005280 [Verticillium longisporum]
MAPVTNASSGGHEQRNSSRRFFSNSTENPPRATDGPLRATEIAWKDEGKRTIHSSYGRRGSPLAQIGYPDIA